MDAAYEVFSDYVWNHQDDLATATHFEWGQLFRTDWQVEARNVARYYAKQVGCLFAQQSLPVPDGIMRFMDGATQADDFVFFLARDRGRRAAQRVALRRGIDGRAYWLPPSSATLTPDGSRVASFSHQAYIGFICVQIDYAAGLSYPSFWESPEAPIVELSGQPPWRVHLMMARARFRQSVERLKLRRANQ